jgi:[protein-PII] uridylyltransferase
MVRHHEKVLAHAEQQLVTSGGADPRDLLALYKKFLKIENHRLRLRHYAGGGGRDIAQQRAGLVDVVLMHLYKAASQSTDSKRRDGAGLALVATGGFGRGELNPFSDVDIMFLHGGTVKKLGIGLSEMIQLILYMLWDIGFKVGHATRTISGAVEQANADMLSKTSLLEARFLVGDRALFDEFKSQFQKRCVRGHEQEYITQRLEDQADRHSKHGGTVYMQEPNVKSGCGGLRDYQNLLWMSYFKEGISTTAQLQERKVLTETERRRLDCAYDFLLRVRTELHYLNKRPTDILTLSFQIQAANKFNYPQKNALRRSEAFMRDYYQHARNIYHIAELSSERLAIGERSKKKRRILTLFKHTKRKEEHFDGFYSVDGKLYPEARDIFNQDAARMMRMFLHVQQRRLELTAELEQLVRRRLHLVDRTFQYARATRDTFSEILSHKGEVGRILRLMHRVDFLGRFIPEFGQLTCLVQHEFFHRYTADEHTLVSIEKLDELIDTVDPKFTGYRELFQKLEDPYVLYLALLLHDTGKASNARYHAEASALNAQKVATRLQLSSERRKSLILLVDNHIALSSTAQRRNLEDPATIAEFAALVKDHANLDALMLLTLADGRGTGDQKWSDWKESLVWQLYKSTSRYLREGEPSYVRDTIERETMRDAVTKKMARDFQDEIDAHFDYMPDIYFRSNDAGKIIAHIRFFRSFLEARCEDAESALAPAVKWIAHPDKGHSEVWICTWDRRQLLAKIAGSFAAAQLNILSADVYTRGDSLVLDIFRVCNTSFQAVTEPKDIAQVEKFLSQALTVEDFDFQPLLQKAKRKPTFHLAQEIDFPTRIVVDNHTHSIYTLIDIQTPDRLGLLYHLLRAMAEEGINIALSRITTEKGAAIDSFYVTGADKHKLNDAAAVRRLQNALHRTAENLAT